MLLMPMCAFALNQCKRLRVGASGIAHQLKALAALAECLALNPSTYTVAYSHR